MNFMWGSAASAEAPREQNKIDRACVSCPTCAFEIPVTDTKRLPIEFSLLCPNCGQRALYRSAGVHAPKPAAGAARASLKIQFGKKADH
jgi:predicted RNA-binding Zn-ribbon protein involved in translation (DUF1610 family)